MSGVTYSVYRAWLERGIGDSPSKPLTGGGNQYLDAHPVIWNDPGTPDKLRPWLLHNSVSVEQLGWAAFPISPWWHFVAYLRGDADRSSYYAHARGWRDADWLDAEFDPGVWLGDVSAFEPQWTAESERQPVQPRQPLERVADWKALVLREPELAALVLAYLYEAILERRSAVWHVPPEDFCAGGDVPELAAFARAALPLESKRLAKIRVNTDSPRIFLAEGVHLLVLGENHEQPHDAATVFNRQGAPKRGCEPKPVYLAFARAVVGRFGSEPGAILRFSSIARSRLGQPEGDPRLLSAAVPIVYNLALAGTRRGQLDVLLAKLFSSSQKRLAYSMQWRNLILDSEWSQVDSETLKRLALEDAPTDDSASLRREVRMQLARRKETLDRAMENWWAADTRHARILLDLLTGQPAVNQDALVSPAAAESRLLSLAASAVAELLTDSTAGAALARLLSDPLPDAWQAPELMKPPNPLQAFQIVASVPRAHVVWRPWLDSWAELIANSNEDRPATLAGALKAISPPHASADLTVMLSYGELYCHFSETAMARSMAEQIAAAMWDGDARRLIMDRCIHGGSRLLEQYLPTKWLLQQDAGEMADELARLLDGRSKSARSAEVTADLIASGRWLQWRLKSMLSEEDLAACAIAWIQAQSPNPPLEEWTQVAGDLHGRLPGATMHALAKSVRDRMPWIRGFQEAQIGGLVRGATDLGAYAEIARLSPRAVGYPAIERLSPPCMEGMPAGSLAALMEPNYSPGFSFSQACQLLNLSGHRRETALSHYVVAYASALAAHDRRAKEDAKNRGLWTDPAFRRRFGEYLVGMRDRIAGSLGSALNEAIELDGEAPALNMDLRAFANQLLSRRFNNLAQFLVPGLRGDLCYQNAALQLCQGKTSGGDWKRVIENAAMATNSGPHPLRQLAGAFDGLSDSEQAQLEANGWAAFWTLIHKDPRLLAIPLGYRGPLPVFMALAKIGTSVPLGRIAVDLLLIKLNRDFILSEQPEWIESLVRAVLTATRRPGGDSQVDDRDAALGRLFRAAILKGISMEKLSSFFDSLTPEKLWRQAGAWTSE